MLRCYYILLVSLALYIPSAHAQWHAKNIVQEFDEFVIYKTDTVNRIDTLGFKQGPGISYEKYHVRTQKRIDQSLTKNKNDDSNVSFCNHNTVSYSTTINYRNFQFGQYLNDKKVGEWKVLWDDNSTKTVIRYGEAEELIEFRDHYPTGETAYFGPIREKGNKILIHNLSKTGHVLNEYWILPIDIDIFLY